MSWRSKEEYLQPEVSKRPLNGVIQILIVWLIAAAAAIAVICIFSVPDEFGLLIIPVPLLIVFVSGVLLESLLKPAYVWKGCFLAGLLGFFIAAINCIFGDYRSGYDKLAIAYMIVFPSVCAAVITSGMRYRQRRSWKDILIAIASVFIGFIIIALLKI